MTPPCRRTPHRRPSWRAHAGAWGLAGLAVLGGCGGGSNPLGNPPDLSNPPGTGGRDLSFAYFQRCVFPVLLAELPVAGGGATATNTCAGGGCHDNTTGTGGALRVIRTATPFDLLDPANTHTLIRGSDMYRNFYSAQGVTLPGEPLQSRLLAKPLLLNMLHGGGKIFDSKDDPNAKLIQYWIDHPVPRDQNEFSEASYGMFNPPNPTTGSCKTE